MGRMASRECPGPSRGWGQEIWVFRGWGITHADSHIHLLTHSHTDTVIQGWRWGRKTNRRDRTPEKDLKS
jgi:hypothetical protein